MKTKRKNPKGKHGFRLTKPTQNLAGDYHLQSYVPEHVFHGLVFEALKANISISHATSLILQKHFSSTTK